jgi:hypothetical protein
MRKGNLIAARGTRVNPLDMVQLRQALVFIDGDNPAEFAWALSRPGAMPAPRSSSCLGLAVRRDEALAAPVLF